MKPDQAVHAVRGEILHYVDEPASRGAAAREHHADGVLIIRNGHIATVGPATELLAQLPADTAVEDQRGRLILPGFIDTHVHCAQIDMIASHGAALLDWLQHHAFPAECRFADAAYAAEVASFFCDELLRNGTTTALAFATVHAAATEALFAAARQRHMRLITGKVLMDRHCPAELCDGADGGEAATRALIERWHGCERLLYALTPRFALGCSRTQLTLAGRLYAEYPGLYLQSHLAENRREIAEVAQDWPEARSYLDVYARHQLLGPRSVYAHCLWLDDEDRRRMATSASAISFCPTSNLFLGSGLFDLARARAHGILVGLGSDVGAGTSLSLLQTMAEAYKVLRLQGQDLDADQAFYLATLGGARSLALEHCIGSFAPGREADFVVLDPAATALMARRVARCTSLSERLFVLMTLGDDRAVAATWLLGQVAWRREAGISAGATR